MQTCLAHVGCLLLLAASLTAAEPTPTAPTTPPSTSLPGFHTRSTEARYDQLTSGGGNKETEAAVRLALEWLAAHQAEDHGWNAGRLKTQDSNVATTSFALLAFFGAGHTDRQGDYQTAVAQALAWLRKQQKKSGRIGPHKYEAGIALIAIAEAYGMTGDAELKREAEKCVKWAKRSQCSTGAWDYEPRSRRSDTSVTGWWVMGLKAARTAELKVSSNAWYWARRYIRAATDKRTGAVAYATREQHVQNVRPGGGTSRMTAVSLLCLQLLGCKLDDSRLQACIKKTLKDGLPWHERHGAHNPRYDFYRWYYATLGLYLYGTGSQEWHEWNQALKDTLLPTQVRAGTVEELKGSWDPAKDEHGARWGRAGQTAIGALMLEVYYRYASVHEATPQEAKEE